MAPAADERAGAAAPSVQAAGGQQAVSGLADADRANGAQPGPEEPYAVGTRVLCVASFDSNSRELLALLTCCC